MFFLNLKKKKQEIKNFLSRKMMTYVYFYNSMIYIKNLHVSKLLFVSN